MQLSNSALTSIKELLSDHSEVSSNDEEANDCGEELLRFMKLFYKPIPKEFLATENALAQL